MSSNLSPNQTLNATKSVGRLMQFRDLLETAGLPARPGDTIAIPMEELECLCRAAAKALNLSEEDFDSSDWVAPAEITYVGGEVVA